MDETPKQLAKRIPELKGIKPVEDQQDLPRILKKTGESVDEFFDNAVDLVAKEEIKQERMAGLGYGGWGRAFRDNYLILRHGNGGDLDFDEFRTDDYGNRLDMLGPQRGLLITAGFALICAHFSTGFQTDSAFRYLGEEKVAGRETYVVAFAQRPGKASLTEMMYGPRGSAVHMLTQGVAWVDKKNFHILRMRTDLLAPHPEIGLDEQTTKVDFSEVRLQDLASPLWLPHQVNVYVKLRQPGGSHFEESFRNEHRYTDYRRYRVSTKMVAPE